MTLLARDEIDVVESWLAFHLNAGVDVVIATDNRSQDGTTEVLEEYARSGRVHLIHEPGEDLRQDEWVTRMARLAATEYGADWVINSDADEFWWPRGASLPEVLDAVPERYGTVGAFLRVFVPRPGTDSFAERMTVRFSALAPDQRPGVAVQADQEGHPPGRCRGPADARQPCARAEPVRAASRLVPHRGVPLPAAHRRADDPQGGAPGDRLRAPHRPRADGVPPEHVRRAARRADRRLLRGPRRRRRRVRAGSCGGTARRRHAIAGRAAGDRRGRARRPSRSRPSSRTPSTRWRRPCSARRTSCASSGGWTSSRAAC